MLRIRDSPDITSTNISVALSEILEDVGISDSIIKMRRNTYLLREKLATNYNMINEKLESLYHFGSQSEGTTTPGLSSDLDCLLCIHNVNVIQSLNEWKEGMTNLLVIQNEMTTPGYCFLQVIRKDVAIPQNEVTDNFTVMGEEGRIFLKNSFLCPEVNQGQLRHGPALMSIGKPNMETDDEVVYAHQCDTWPRESSGWINSLEESNWPSRELVWHSENSGFFVVPVGSKIGKYKDLEWRISTSKAERHLMFSMNITQIQCYVLLKMIMKSFINPISDESISSFICKTALFHCISKSCSDIWTRERLIECLTFCLHTLNGYITSGNCPHFMSYRNNLLAGRYSTKTKLDLIQIFHRLLTSVERTLLRIPIDDVGKKLQAKLNCLGRTNVHGIATPACLLIAGTMLQRTGIFACLISNMIDMDLEDIADNSTEVVRVLFTFIRHVSNIQAESGDDKKAKELLYATLLGKLSFSLMILNKDKNVGASNSDLLCLSSCYTTDIASSRLKVASFFYIDGDLAAAALILGNIKSSYDFKSVETVCGCIRRRSTPLTVKQSFNEKALKQNEQNVMGILKTNISFCVRFTTKEECAIPLELKFEIYKFIYDDMSKGKEEICFRKALVRVDSLPYLFFLQYKIYGHLRKRAEQMVALYNFEQTIEREDNLGHRETALNLLGQCMEDEGRLIDALFSYWKSLTIHPENNAAKLLICSCFAKFHQPQEPNSQV